MEETIKINSQEAIVMVEKKINLIEYALELKVKNPTTFEQAVEVMKAVKEAKLFLKDKKNNILNPLSTAVKNIKSLFQPAESKALMIESHLKEQVTSYNLKLKAEEDKRAKQAEKDIAKGKPIEKSIEGLEKTQEKIQAIPTRKIQKIRIIDFSKIPDEFKILNEPKVKESFKTGIKIKGLEEYFEEIIINKF